VSITDRAAPISNRLLPQHRPAAGSNSKHQTPNTKLQENFKLQTSNLKKAGFELELELGVWCLVFEAAATRP
jgi:hypothetical protein